MPSRTPNRDSTQAMGRPVAPSRIQQPVTVATVATSARASLLKPLSGTDDAACGQALDISG